MSDSEYASLPDFETDAPSPQKLKKTATNGHAPGVFAAPDIIASYLYKDAEGAPAFRSIRLANGRRAIQRPVPGHAGSWTWGARKGAYVRRVDGVDFFPLKEDRTAINGWIDLVTIDDEVSHLLYNFPEIRDELLQSEDDRRTIWVCRDEDSCAILSEWGLLSTTHSAGIKGWDRITAEYLSGADVVVVASQDAPSRAIAKCLYGKAKRVRVLDLPENVLAWHERGGAKADLLKLADLVRDWSPEPYKSKFGAVTWKEVSQKRAPYKYLIYGVLPAHERAMLFGEPGSGKSFTAQTFGLCCARGEKFEGRTTEKCGVIYCAFEGGKGFVNRVEGYRQYHGLSTEDNIPFVMLTRSADLFSDENAVKDLREEITHFAGVFAEMGYPLGLIVFDTVSASSGGMDENKGDQVGRYLDHGKKIVEGLNTAVLYVHHKPKDGSSPRGSGKFTGDLEATIEVFSDKTGATDDHGRPIRVVKVGKLREGESNKEISRFVLRRIEIDKDEHGDPVTTCVWVKPGAEVTAGAGISFMPSRQEANVFRAFLHAWESVGFVPPPESGVPATVDKVITYQQWRDAYAATDLGDDNEETSKRMARIRQAMKRSGEKLIAPRFKWSPIGMHSVDEKTKYFWWNGNAVRGFSQTFAKGRTKPKEEESAAADQMTIDDF